MSASQNVNNLSKDGLTGLKDTSLYIKMNEGVLPEWFILMVNHCIDLSCR